MVYHEGDRVIYGRGFHRPGHEVVIALINEIENEFGEFTNAYLVIDERGTWFMVGDGEIRPLDEE